MIYPRQFTRECPKRSCCRHRHLVALVILQILGGCGGSNNNASGTQPPPPAEDAIHGRYVGTARIDGRDYFADAMLAKDGTTHLYVGGLHSDSETIQLAAAEGSIYFSGSVAAHGTLTSGPGRVIGREPDDCGQPGSPSSRWCGRASSASISLDEADSSEAGAIHGEIIVNDESWTLDLIPWSGAYNQPARLEDLAGLYAEMVAPFASNGDLVVNIDADGRAFFQGFPYWCTGNATFVPHGDGNHNVFDVEMSLATCDYPYTLLNGDYRGLATLSPSELQGTDSNLRVWISRFSPQSSAVTMWGIRLSGRSSAEDLNIR